MASRKGSPNKTTAKVKDNILAVFNRLEGTAGLEKWARANETEFYKFYLRLLPTETADLKSIEVTGNADKPFVFITRAE